MREAFPLCHGMMRVLLFSFYMDIVSVLSVSSAYSSHLTSTARKRLVAPHPRGGEKEAQEEAARTEPQFLFHGCQVSRYVCALIQLTARCVRLVNYTAPDYV